MNNFIIKNFGIKHYIYTLNKMHIFNKNRSKNTLDEIWFTQHYPIFTLGMSHKNISFKKETKIPIINSNRGGKETYHGPGQQLIYFLIDIKRRKINIRYLINFLELSIVKTLNYLGIYAHTIKCFPGVYINNKKVCSIGLYINNKGYSMHGLALNVNMDLTPFSFINPCGKKKLIMTQLKDFLPNVKIKKIISIFLKNIYYF